MPAGVSWGRYLRFSLAAMLSMMAGAQIVHIYYTPLADLNILVAEQVRKKKQQLEHKNS